MGDNSDSHVSHYTLPLTNKECYAISGINMKYLFISQDFSCI